MVRQRRDTLDTARLVLAFAGLARRQRSLGGLSAAGVEESWLRTIG